MRTPGMTLIDLTLQQAQRWHHLVWFLYGCVEREQMLNMDAFVAWSGWTGHHRRRHSRQVVDGRTAAIDS